MPTIQVYNPITGDYEDLKAIEGLFNNKGIFDSQIMSRTGQISEDGIIPKFLWSGGGILGFTRTQFILNHHLANVHIKNLGELASNIDDDTSNILRVSFGLTDYVKNGDSYHITEYLMDSDKLPVNIYPGCTFNEYIDGPFNVIEIYTLKQETPENIPFEILLEQTGQITFLKNQTLPEPENNAWNPVNDSLWVYYDDEIRVYDIPSSTWVNTIPIDGVLGIMAVPSDNGEHIYYIQYPNTTGEIATQTGQITSRTLTDIDFITDLARIPVKYPVIDDNGDMKLCSLAYYGEREDFHMTRLEGVTTGLEEIRGVCNGLTGNNIPGATTYTVAIGIKNGLPAVEFYADSLEGSGTTYESDLILEQSPLNAKGIAVPGDPDGGKMYILTANYLLEIDYLKQLTDTIALPNGDAIAMQDTILVDGDLTTQIIYILDNNGNNLVKFDPTTKEFIANDALPEPGREFWTEARNYFQDYCYQFLYLTNTAIKGQNCNNETINIPLARENPIGFSIGIKQHNPQ